MQISRMILCDGKCPKPSVSDQHLQNENREIKALENRARWIFYETGKF